MKKLFRLAGLLFLHEWSKTPLWRWAFDIADGVLAVTLWYFVARFFGAQHRLHAGSGLDYFTFSLIGLTLAQYVWRGFSAISRHVNAFLDGAPFEVFWLLPCPLPLLVILSSAWDFLRATINGAVVLGFGVFFFGARISWGCAVSLVGIGLLTSIAMGALGLLLSSFSQATGVGNPLYRLVSRTIPFLSGAFFSVSLFPAWLKWVSGSIPLTHALSLARGIASSPGNAGDPRAWVLLAQLTAVYAAAGWLALEFSVRRARRGCPPCLSTNAPVY